MTSFVIDTGITEYRKPHEHWYWDVIRDHLPHDASEEAIYIEIGKVIVCSFWKHKKPETVRSDLIKNWEVLAYMANVAPESFDHVITEFAERAAEFR